MAYAIITNGIVTNMIEADADYAAGIGAVSADGAGIGYIYDGEAFTAPEPDLAQIAARTQAEIVAATQLRLDTFAQTRNYDGILSACTYATSGVPTFAAEGQYCVDARDATWSALYTIMGEVIAQTRPMPESFADIQADLPALVWPA